VGCAACYASTNRFLPVVWVVLNFVHEPGRYILQPIFALLPMPERSLPKRPKTGAVLLAAFGLAKFTPLQMGIGKNS
jgi:hypothetical protein